MAIQEIPRTQTERRVKPTPVRYQGGWARGQCPSTEALVTTMKKAKGGWLSIRDIALAIYQRYDDLTHKRVITLISRYNQDRSENRIQSYSKIGKLVNYRLLSPGVEPTLPPNMQRRIDLFVNILMSHRGQWVPVDDMARLLYEKNNSRTRGCVRNITLQYKKQRREPALEIKKFRTRIVVAYRFAPDV